MRFHRLPRHLVLPAAAVALGILVFAGVATAGILLARNLNEGTTPSTSSADNSASPGTSPAASASASASPDPARNIAACGRAASPHRKTAALLKTVNTKGPISAAVIGTIPPIRADLSAAAATATGVLQRDLQEIASALGELHTALIQGRDRNSAAAKVLIYVVILKAECDF